MTVSHTTPRRPVTPEEMVENVRTWKKVRVMTALEADMIAEFANKLAEMVINIAGGGVKDNPFLPASALSLAYKIVGREAPEKLDEMAMESPYVKPSEDDDLEEAEVLPGDISYQRAPNQGYVKWLKEQLERQACGIPCDSVQAAGDASDDRYGRTTGRRHTHRSVGEPEPYQYKWSGE